MRHQHRAPIFILPSVDEPRKRKDPFPSSQNSPTAASFMYEPSRWRKSPPTRLQRGSPTTQKFPLATLDNPRRAAGPGGTPRVPTKVCVRSTSHLANYKVEFWGKMSGGGTRQQHRAAPASAQELQHAGAEKPHGRPPTSSLNAHIAEAAHIRIGVSFEHRRILRKHSCWPMRRSTDFEVLDMGDALRTNRYAS